MKLRTELREQPPLTCDFDALKHDAAAARALMQAMRQYESDFPLSAAAPQDVIQWIEKRADEIMAGWGFNSGEDA